MRTEAAAKRMRGATSRALVIASVAFGIVWTSATDVARSDDGEIVAELQSPGELQRGVRTALELRVRITPPNDAPVLVTPTNEGPAVQVVRGRLLRADAVDARAAELRFQIPVIASQLGTSVVRARVRAYSCRSRCRWVEALASVIVRVRE